LFSVERITTSAVFFDLRQEWNELLSRSRADCVFLTHEWLSTWWRHLAEGRDLHIVTIRESGRLIGILPLALRRPQYARMMPRILEFLGSGLIGSDYLDVIADEAREEEVLDAFAHYLTTAGLMIQCAQLRRNDCVVRRLAAKLATRDWSVEDVKINVCPYIPLIGHTWETYLASIGSSQRYNFQRRLRNLEKTPGFRFQHETSLDVVMDLHHKRWVDRGGLSEAFQTSAIVGFHREFANLAADSGWLRLLSIWIDNRPAAALYGLRYGPKFFFYQSGFDPSFSKQSVGLVMMGLAIRTAIDEGAAEYDLLHGDEGYKFHWALETRELGRIELFPPQVRGAFYKRCVTFNRAARRAFRRMLTQTGW